MFRDFWHGLPRRFLDSFRGYNLFWHLIAIVLTAALVLSGFDWWYHLFARESFLERLTLPAGIIGFFMPVILPVFLYWLGLRGRPYLLKAAIASAQAGILGWLISSCYKAFTGRMQPEFLYYTTTVDLSRNFQFGFWEHGIFWGWPSSHTAVAFAMSVALVVLYPNRPLIRALAVLYAFFIGIGMSVAAHWFSDFVAGAIIGSVIGLAVGRAYRDIKIPVRTGTRRA